MHIVQDGKEETNGENSGYNVLKSHLSNGGCDRLSRKAGLRRLSFYILLLQDGVARLLQSHRGMETAEKEMVEVKSSLQDVGGP